MSSVGQGQLAGVVRLRLRLGYRTLHALGVVCEHHMSCCSIPIVRGLRRVRATLDAAFLGIPDMTLLDVSLITSRSPRCMSVVAVCDPRSWSNLVWGQEDSFGVQLDRIIPCPSLKALIALVNEV